MKKISVTALHGYLELASSYEIDPYALLARCSIDVDTVESQKGFIFGRQVSELLELTVEKTGDSTFGLKLSKKQGHSILGMLGLMMEKSRDVRSAVNSAIRYLEIYTDNILAELKEEGNLAIFSFRLIEDSVQCPATIDLTMGTNCNIVRILTQQPNAIKSVYLTHDKPSDESTYRKLFGAPVVYNHEMNALIYDRKLLDLPLPSYDPLLYTELANHIEESLNETTVNTSEQVRGLIRKNLVNGGHTIDFIATKLNVSSRQLQYLLSKEGVTFKKLLDGVRKNVAQQTLLQSNVSVTQLGEMLGYSDQTAFGRAFKRWFGMRPREWKKSSSRESF